MSPDPLSPHLAGGVRLAVEGQVDVDVNAGGGPVRAIPIQEVEDGCGAADGHRRAALGEEWQRAQGGRGEVHGRPGGTCRGLVADERLVWRESRVRRGISVRQGPAVSAEERGKGAARSCREGGTNMGRGCQADVLMPSPGIRILEE